MVGVFRLFRTIISCNIIITDRPTLLYSPEDFWFWVKSSVFCFSVKSSVFLIKSSGFEVNLLFWRKIVWFSVKSSVLKIFLVNVKLRGCNFTANFRKFYHFLFYFQICYLCSNLQKNRISRFSTRTYLQPWKFLLSYEFLYASNIYTCVENDVSTYFWKDYCILFV